MRVCLVGGSHLTDDDRMFYREGLTLSKRYSVEVLGAGQFNQRVIRNGVTVTSYRKRSKPAHIALLTEIFLYLRRGRFDIIHCFDLDSLAVAVIVSRFLPKRPQIVYDAHEHFPSLMTYYFRLPKALSDSVQFLLDVLERSLASHCAGFISVNETLRKRFSVFNKPNVILRNLPSLSWYDNATTLDVLQDIADPVVFYVGILDWKKGLHTMVRAKQLLDRQGTKVCFVVVGTIKGASFYASLDSLFRFVGPVDYQDLPSFLRRASIGLALIQPVNVNYLIAEPSKVFHYMVAGLPIIGSNLTSINPIIMQENCGFLVNPYDADEVAEAITRLLREDSTRKEMAKNAAKSR